MKLIDRNRFSYHLQVHFKWTDPTPKKFQIMMKTWEGFYQLHKETSVVMKRLTLLHGE